MIAHKSTTFFILFFFSGLMLSAAATARQDEANPDEIALGIQGEYVGTLGEDDQKVGIQVIALGDGKFRAVGFMGGLPGDGWDGSETPKTEATLEDGQIVFKNDHITATLKETTIKMTGDGDLYLGELKRVQRKSDTLGAKPPEGAIVLFDGTSADNFVSTRGGEKAKMEDGLLVAGANSVQRFGDHHLHIEFRLPFQPKARGQGRGNSGCYLQGRYEVQMLDSFGLEGKHNECGGLYSIKDPDVNMCFPPMSWQTYDIDFTAARFDDQGKKTADAKMTVKHNGVVIHDNVDLPKTTTAAPIKDGKERGILHLQDHGNPVHYRNIWVVEK